VGPFRVEEIVQADEDTVLMQKVAKGDRNAFGELFDRHQASVVRFCHRLVGNPAEAEELAQDVFVKLYRSAHTYRPSARFKTFLFRVATNHCLNELRRPARKAEQVADRSDDGSGSDSIDPLATELTPHHALEARDVERAVSRALKAMSERERAAFAMCRFEGMAYKDIAGALDASEAAVKSLIHRATLHVVRQLDALEAPATPASGVAHG
jgi:RNA polymerase sigma-70 factor, ECF subfamily